MFPDAALMCGTISGGNQMTPRRRRTAAFAAALLTVAAGSAAWAQTSPSAPPQTPPSARQTAEARRQAERAARDADREWMRGNKATCWDYDDAHAAAAQSAACSNLIRSQRLRSEYELSLSYEFRARALVELEDYERAVEDLTSALVFNPRADPALVMRGYANARLGRAASAQADWTRAIEMNPRNVHSYINIAGARIEAEDTAGALETVRAGLARAPRDARLQNLLCWTLGIRNEALDEAAAACDAALRREPRAAYMIDSLGLVRLRQGNPAEAEAVYSRALALDAGQAGSLYGRGLARRRLGRTAEGDADLAAAAALDPELPARFAGWGLAPE